MHFALFLFGTGFAFSCFSLFAFVLMSEGVNFAKQIQYNNILGIRLFGMQFKVQSREFQAEIMQSFLVICILFKTTYNLDKVSAEIAIAEIVQSLFHLSLMTF